MKLSEFKRRLVAGSFPAFPDLATALERLHFVQADPIRSPARAQDLMLRQRVVGYRAGDLEAGFEDLDAEEGYLFAYGFMKPEVWSDLRGRNREGLSELEKKVLAAVSRLGEAHPRDLDDEFGQRAVKNYWGGKSKETKRVLEELHDDGFLRVSRREKGIRIYQVPAEAIEEERDPVERFSRLTLLTARIFGPTTKSFLLSELKALNHLVPKRAERERAVEQLIAEGELEELMVEGINYLWKSEEWQLDGVPERVRILAPFDLLVRNRQRFEQVWNWRYRFEAYVPAAERERGYYAMPLLWRDEVIGWVNAKVTGKRLEVEPGFANARPREQRFRKALEEEVEAMAVFLGLESGAWEVTR